MNRVEPLRHMPRPCIECPWRRDTPPGQFPACRYEQLAETAGWPGAEAPLGAPLFACHMTAEGREVACAGWLAVVGREHLAVRFAVAVGRLSLAVLEPAPDWPDLFSTYTEMAQRQGRVDGLRRILITGSRDWTDAETIRAAIRQAALRCADAVVVHGAARGADLMAGAAARALGLQEERHPARWDELGKAAGFIRNHEMVQFGADVCLAFIKDGSRGATHCAALAEKAGIPVRRFEIREER